MHLTKRHAVENELIDKIRAALEAQNLIEVIDGLPGRYGNKTSYLFVISATAMSIAAMAAKKKVADPMAFFDIGKVSNFIAAAARNVTNPHNKTEMLPTLTTYDDRVRILYEKEMTYKGRRYYAHPIEGGLDDRATITAIPLEDHIAHLCRLLDEAGIPYVRSEVEAVFTRKTWTYQVPVILDDSDSRFPLSYHAHEGSIPPEVYHQALAWQENGPRLCKHTRNTIIEQFKAEIEGQANLEFSAKMLVDLQLMRGQGTNYTMHLRVHVPVTMLDHHLRPHQEIIYCGTQLTLTENELQAYEAGNDVPQVSDSLDRAMSDLLKTLKNRGLIANRRVKAKKNLGDNALSIDRVAQTIIMLVAAENPAWARDIIMGKRKHFHFRQPQDYVWLGEGRADQGRVGFRTRDGKLSASFRMSQDQSWSNNCLLVPPLPELVGESITGRPSGEVLDHPLAQMLGAVKSVKTRYRKSAITFETTYDPIDRETLLAQIPEPAVE